MDLWVRSQNREILRINPELEIYEYGNTKFLVMDTKGYVDYGKAKILGEYKTKERALEVLDEIEKILQPKIFVKSGEPIAETCDGLIYRKPDEVEIQELSIVVYEMPKE